MKINGDDFLLDFQKRVMGIIAWYETNGEQALDDLLADISDEFEKFHDEQLEKNKEAKK